MIEYPYGSAFQASQPLVLMQDQIWCLTGERRAAAHLRTAAGKRHGLAPFATIGAASKKGYAALRPAVEGLLLDELPRRVAELQNDALAYFIEFLAPAFDERDAGAHSCSVEPAAPLPTSIDWTTAVQQASARFPVPRLTCPALWFLGREWRLVRQPSRAGCWQVVLADGCLGLSGDYARISSLDSSWKQELARFVKETATHLSLSRIEIDRSGPLEAARRELAANGCVERGELVFLQENPPRLGHIIPPHYNTTLGSSVRRDLAVTAPFLLPFKAIPDRGQLAVFRRIGSSWQPASLPHGLCLGPDAESQSFESAGIAAAAYLRWAAIRIADNGAFHASDGSSTESGDYDNAY